MDLYILRHILSFVCDMDWDTFSRLRVLNRAISRWLMSTYWFRPFNRLYPTRSFVSCNICMSCDRVSASLKSFTMPNTYFPRPVFVYCNRFNCIRTAVRSMVAYANDSNTVLLINEAVHTQFGKVLRSSGVWQECIYDLGYLFKRSHCIRCRFGINLVKDIPVGSIPNEFRRQYRLLTL